MGRTKVDMNYITGRTELEILERCADFFNDEDFALEDVVGVLLDAGLVIATGKEKQKLKMLKSSYKLMRTTSSFLRTYAQSGHVTAFTEEELEYLHHFFEAMCEAIKDFQKEVVPLKE